MLLFDIETNGLLTEHRNKDGSISPSLSTVHCLVTLDTETGTIVRYRGDDIRIKGLPALSAALALGGHNVIKFDLPALEKVYGWKYAGEVYDSLVASRLAFADIKVDDRKKTFQKGSPNAKLAGSHSLKAWGIRLGVLKGTFAEDNGESCWDVWTPEMEDYCEQDVHVTHKLWQPMQKQGLTPLSLWLEHEFCKVITRQERRGVGFNVQGGENLLVDLLVRREEAG